MEQFDIAIIGTGPAGLSAALTATIRNKRIVLFGRKSLSEKVEKAHVVENYLGLPHTSGADMARAFQIHLDSLGITITDERVTAVYSMGDYFALQTSSNSMIGAATVILATGMVTARPYEGEVKFLGRGVSYCATCDAPLYKGKVVAVIGGSAEEEAEADFLAEVASKVYYFPLYKGDVNVSPKIEVIREVPQSIDGGLKVATLKTAGSEYAVDGVFILRQSVAPAQLVPGLAMEENHVGVTRQMETNIKGLFACGDATGRPYQYIKAAGEGNVAALAAVAYMDQKRRESK